METRRGPKIPWKIASQKEKKW
eukprot:SAG31_NODE_47709_length_225_cov_11.936508_1_plen_21_part_10